MQNISIGEKEKQENSEQEKFISSLSLSYPSQDLKPIVLKTHKTTQSLFGVCTDYIMQNMTPKEILDYIPELVESEEIDRRSKNDFLNVFITKYPQEIGVWDLGLKLSQKGDPIVFYTQHALNYIESLGAIDLINHLEALLAKNSCSKERDIMTEHLASLGMDLSTFKSSIIEFDHYDYYKNFLTHQKTYKSYEEKGITLPPEAIKKLHSCAVQYANSPVAQSKDIYTLAGNAYINLVNQKTISANLTAIFSTCEKPNKPTYSEVFYATNQNRGLYARKEMTIVNPHYLLYQIYNKITESVEMSAKVRAIKQLLNNIDCRDVVVKKLLSNQTLYETQDKQMMIKLVSVLFENPNSLSHENHETIVSILKQEMTELVGADYKKRLAILEALDWIKIAISDNTKENKVAIVKKVLGLDFNSLPHEKLIQCTKLAPSAVLKECNKDIAIKLLQEESIKNSINSLAISHTTRYQVTDFIDISMIKHCDFNTKIKTNVVKKLYGTTKDFVSLVTSAGLGGEILLQDEITNYFSKKEKKEYYNCIYPILAKEKDKYYENMLSILKLDYFTEKDLAFLAEVKKIDKDNYETIFLSALSSCYHNHKVTQNINKLKTALKHPNFNLGCLNNVNNVFWYDKEFVLLVIERCESEEVSVQHYLPQSIKLILKKLNLEQNENINDYIKTIFQKDTLDKIMSSSAKKELKISLDASSKLSVIEKTSSKSTLKPTKTDIVLTNSTELPSPSTPQAPKRKVIKI